MLTQLHGVEKLPVLKEKIADILALERAVRKRQQVPQNSRLLLQDAEGMWLAWKMFTSSHRMVYSVSKWSSQVHSECV